MSKVGSYKGVKWHQKSLCDMYPHLTIKALWYFPLDGDGKYTGDHFKTLKELYNWIESNKKD